MVKRYNSLTGKIEESVQVSGNNVLKAEVQRVPTAGKRVQLPNFPCHSVLIIALKSNTGSIYVGSDNVSSSTFGAELSANESVELELSNTNLIWIDASVSGEGISYACV